jgi:hypothetical protein
VFMVKINHNDGNGWTTLIPGPIPRRQARAIANRWRDEIEAYKGPYPERKNIRVKVGRAKDSA